MMKAPDRMVSTVTGTVYVRADIHDRLTAEIERLREALAEWVDPYASYSDDEIKRRFNSVIIARLERSFAALSGEAAE